MNSKHIFGALIATFVTAGSGMAQAAGPTPCAPHEAIVAKLKGTYQEQISSLGLSANGHVMQIFSTAEGETWTLLSTSPAGMTCILASGKHWQTALTVPSGPAA